MKIKNLFKNLLKFCFIVTIVSSSKLLPMNMLMDPIDLKINNSKINPKSQDISIYDQSKEKAAEFVHVKKLEILKLIEQTEDKLEKEKLRLEAIYIKQINKLELNYNKKALPEYMQKLIINIIEKPNLQKELGIIGINIKDNIIIAERYSGGPIKFLLCDLSQSNQVSSLNKIPASPVFSNGYNIIFSQKYLLDDKYKYSSEELEAFICHELAHIKCKHSLEESCFRSLYKKQIKENKITVDISNFNNAISQWHRAIEIQADIIGIFNDFTFLETIKKYWQYHANIIESIGINKYSYELDTEHPPAEIRANYFQQIYSAILIKSQQIAIPKIIINNETKINNIPKLPEKLTELPKQEPIQIKISATIKSQNIEPKIIISTKITENKQKFKPEGKQYKFYNLIQTIISKVNNSQIKYKKTIAIFSLIILSYVILNKNHKNLISNTNPIKI